MQEDTVGCPGALCPPPRRLTQVLWGMGVVPPQWWPPLVRQMHAWAGAVGAARRTLVYAVA